MSNILSIILINIKVLKTLYYSKFMNNFTKKNSERIIDIYILYLKFEILIMLKMQRKKLGVTKGNNFWMRFRRK